MRIIGFTAHREIMKTWHRGAKARKVVSGLQIMRYPLRLCEMLFH